MYACVSTHTHIQTPYTPKSMLQEAKTLMLYNPNFEHFCSLSLWEVMHLLYIPLATAEILTAQGTKDGPC